MPQMRYLQRSPQVLPKPNQLQPDNNRRHNDTASIECMRVKSSGTKQMNTCQGCPQTTCALDWSASPLLERYFTCEANDEFGDEQAVACWEGQPNDLTPCVSATTFRSEDRGGSGGSASGADARGDEEPRSVSGALRVGFFGADLLQYTHARSFGGIDTFGCDE
ncbi:MAG: hypothetical protein Q9180_007026, partial [Flavoplaca navasiana]